MNIKITMTVNTDSDVFNEDIFGPGARDYALWNIFGTWADSVCNRGLTNMPLRDDNGNTVGRVEVEKTSV